MIWDLSRLPLEYQRFSHYARSICTYDFDRFGIARIDVFPIRGPGGAGWAHPASSETGGPAIGVRVDDAALRDPDKDYVGRVGQWAANSTSRKYQQYRHLGCGEWTLAIDLHEALGHMLGFFVIDKSPALKQKMVDITGQEAARNDHHIWIPHALKAFTDMNIKEVPAAQADAFKAAVLA